MRAVLSSSAVAVAVWIGCCPLASARQYGGVFGMTVEDDVFGAKVAAVAENSQAEELGVEVGDLIVKAGDHFVTSAWDLLAHIDGAGPELRLNTRQANRETRIVTLRRPELAGTIVFRSERSGTAELWRMNADGSDLRQLTTGNRQAQGPAWSPDGQSIAFEWWTPGGSWDIWTMSADGYNVRRMTTHPDADTRPRWSADGAYVYFISYRWGGTAIGRVNIHTMQEERVAKMADEAGTAPWRYPVYDVSPQDGVIAYPLQTPAGWKLRLADPDGQNPRDLGLAGEQIALDWSSDAARLLWAGPTAERYCVRETESGAVRQFTLQMHGWACFTPDGEHLLHDAKREGEEQTDLYVSDLDGKPLHRLTYHPASDTQADWCSAAGAGRKTGSPGRRDR